MSGYRCSTLRADRGWRGQKGLLGRIEVEASSRQRRFEGRLIESLRMVVFDEENGRDIFLDGLEKSKANGR